MSFDWKRLSTLDRAIIGGAVVAFIAAFLPWYGVSFGGLGITVSGWSAGFSAWAGALLLTTAGVLLVLRRAGTTFNLGNAGPAVLVAGVAAVGLLLVIIRWISFPRYHGVDVGARYGIYIALLAGIVEVTAAVMQMRASGESVPWAQTRQAPEQPEAPPEAPAVPDE
jgi:hypothetical protein